MITEPGTGRIGLLYLPWPDTESATEAGRMMGADCICACVNIIPRIISVYQCNGNVQTTGSPDE